MEEEIIRRSRLTADAHAADVRILRDTDVHAEPLPQLLLITERPDPAWTNRLATTVRLGHAADISAVVIGDWPPGTTLTVASDGTTGNDTPRLSVLDTATATDMLGLLREAHGPSDTPASPEKPSTPATENTEPALPSGPQTAERVAAPAATPTAVPVPEGDRLPVTVRVLGRPAVLDANGQPSPGIRSKAVELMVYLAVNRQGADLSDIMEALYPDANMRRATERLSTVVADLRKHIRRAAATPTDTTESLRQRLEPVPNTGSRYHLDPTIVAVDWWTVLDQYEAVATTTDTSRQLTHLTAALAAAGGPLADGVEYDWIDTDREVVRRHRIKLHVHAAALLADTDPHQSWLLLEQACQIDPLSDDLARTTMRAAAALGDADAIRHRLKTLREALDTHGLDMADDTQALAQGLLHRLHPPKTSA
jgi:DNA-binding SARP family transcriptional activator